MLGGFELPYKLTDLVIDRVDLVDEGANSAAHIELFKRKETKPMNLEEILSKLHKEHADVVQHELDAKDAELAKARGDLDAANAELAKARGDLDAANAELTKVAEERDVLKAKGETCTCEKSADNGDGVCKACGKKIKKSAGFDETETMKAMPQAARELFEKMRAQRDAAEAQVRKNAEEKKEAEAVAKAATLKALPCEQEKLVGILKSCDPEVMSLLEAANAAIEHTVLADEVGKNKGNGAADASDAWSQLEAKAREIAKRDNVTVEKAMTAALNENPELYDKYLNGGAK